MKVAILLSTLLVATAYAITTDNLAGIKVPTAKDIEATFAPEASCNAWVSQNGPCSVSTVVCSFPVSDVWNFRATACTPSDVCATSTSLIDSYSAMGSAIYNLLLLHPPCACGSANTTIGTCNFNINSCFQLDTTLTHPSYYASATCTKNAISADYCCAATGEDAAKAAMTALAGKMNIQTTCM
jgi:hypothetical protein